MGPFSSNRPSCYLRQLILTALFVWAFDVQPLFSTPNQIWEELPPLAEGRPGMLAFTMSGSKPAYFGGTSWQDGVNQFHVSGFILHNRSWKSLEPLTDPIAYAAVAAKDGVIYAVGGTDGTELRPGTVVFNSSPKIAWTKRQSLPAPTRGTVALALPDIGILVVGGYIEEGVFSPDLLLFGGPEHPGNADSTAGESYAPCFGIGWKVAVLVRRRGRSSSPL